MTADSVFEFTKMVGNEFRLLKFEEKPSGILLLRSKLVRSKLVSVYNEILQKQAKLEIMFETLCSQRYLTMKLAKLTKCNLSYNYSFYLIE